VVTRTYARIQNDAVVELLATNGDISTIFHHDLHWVDVSAVKGIAHGWVYDGRGFIPPPMKAADPA
jgi:hypothetical protein